ncbi:MAG: nucleotide pyrophosphohydrolase [Nocardioides sp.]|nr:nucleotide pyrophosphohydrolase [Nocardioides sp.]
MAGLDDEVTGRIREFAVARDWERFHTPKNLAMALVGEAGELAAELQWLTSEESADAADPGPLRDRVSAEMADVAIYLLRLADVLDVDLAQAVSDKLDVNEERFPSTT